MRALLILVAGLCASCPPSSASGGPERARGIVVANTAHVAAPFAGRVAQVAVQNGARVDANQVLVVLDVSALQSRRDELQAELDRLAAELSGLERGSTPEELREQRARCDLLGVRAKHALGTEKELLDAEFAFEKERFDRMSKGAPRDVLESARAAVRAAQARLRSTADALGRAEVRASQPAIVHALHVEAGEDVAAHAVLVTLRDPARMFVEADLAPLGSGWQLGARVFVTTTHLPGERFEGTVVELSMPPAPLEPGRAAFVRARIDVSVARERLTPCSAVEVEIAH